MRIWRTSLPLLLAALTLSACAAEEAAEEAPPPPAEEPAPAQEAMGPEATADAMWAYLQAEDYQNWPMWPGRDALYGGSQPHGALLTMHVNDIALAAAEAGSTSFPAGAIVVKENYRPDSTLAAVTVMYKVEGFNPDHNDWWFLKRNADGSVDVEGRGEGCENCHAGAADVDYLFALQEDANAQD